MPRYIIKIKDKYFEYSTIVDAPVTYGLTLEQFREHYKEQYGRSSMEELEERMKRVDTKGTSSRLDESVEETVSGNVAGEDGECLTVDEIYEKYTSGQ